MVNGFMEKKLYITPLFEVTACETVCGIMKTSIILDVPDPAPKRRTEAF